MKKIIGRILFVILLMIISICLLFIGNGYYNIKDAAQGYFGKLPKDMTDGESIMLAGIPNAPSVYAPTENPELAKQRQKQVIEKMIEYGYLTEEEAEKIINENE